MEQSWLVAPHRECYCMSEGESPAGLGASSLPALGQFNTDTSTLPHFSDGKIGGKHIVDQIKENSSIPSNLKNVCGHSCELYHQLFILVVRGKVEFGHNWGKPAEESSDGRAPGDGFRRGKAKTRPQVCKHHGRVQRAKYPSPSHPMPVGISLDGAWSSVVYGRCPCPLQRFGMG